MLFLNKLFQGAITICEWSQLSSTQKKNIMIMFIWFYFSNKLFFNIVICSEWNTCVYSNNNWICIIKWKWNWLEKLNIKICVHHFHSIFYAMVCNRTIVETKKRSTKHICIWMAAKFPQKNLFFGLMAQYFLSGEKKSPSLLLL